MKGTEAPPTGGYRDCTEEGTYRCACCTRNLYDAYELNFDSGTGCATFWAPIKIDELKLVEDYMFERRSIEVQCSSCNAILGHVFWQRSHSTGKRYCINSESLQLGQREQLHQKENKEM
ncbi:MAG: peptide-methionine (R)-S-oxide reductase [Thermoproteota archaeon]|nr:peptide-methionine (R)-S-oxide reductase [Thermoproteota archaeon]